MISTFALFLIVAGQNLQIFSPFNTRDECDFVKEQVEREFHPHHAACIEIRAHQAPAPKPN